jgi:hypothetical protein
MALRSLIAVACVAALIACGTPPPRVDVNNSAQMASRVQIKRDDFKKVTNYTGPEIRSEGGGTVNLRAWKTDALGVINFQVYGVDFYSGEWKFHNSAYDSNGTRMDFVSIARDVGSCGRYSCSHYEHFGLNVTRDYLEKASKTGMHFKVSGRAGEAIFFIPGGYIDGFLTAVK